MAKTVLQWRGRSQPFQNKMLSATKTTLAARGVADVQVGIDLKGRMKFRGRKQ